METKIKNQEPAFIVSASDFNGEGSETEIYWSDLEAAKVGDSWSASGGGSLRSCRNYHELIVMYADEETVLCKESEHIYADSDNAMHRDNYWRYTLRLFQLRGKLQESN